MSPNLTDATSQSQPRSSFLDAVATNLLSSGIDPAKLTLVFPNKRSGMFMRRSLKRLNGKHLGIMPRILTLPAWLEKITAQTPGNHIELLFLLYKSYCNVLTQQGRAEAIHPFHDFIFWGDIMLQDFDDLDMADVETDQFFKNLRDLKEIRSYFLTPEQADAYEEIWGYRPPSAQDVDAFWEHLAHAAQAQGESQHVTAKGFMSLWKIMGDVYQEFQATLEKEGITYPGAIMRNAARCIANGDFEPSYTTVFIGFNRAPLGLQRIFRSLKAQQRALFYWDLPNLYQRLTGNPEAEKTMNHNAMRTIGVLAREFPMPEGFDLPRMKNAPLIEVFSIASQNLQASLTANVLDRWRKPGYINFADPTSTAVVLPDASLLAPLLGSLNSGFLTVNITMGMSYRDTPMATLMQQITSMHNRVRQVRGRPEIFHDDLQSLAQNATITTISLTQARAILDLLKAPGRYTVPLDEVKAIAPDLAFIFQCPGPKATFGQMEAYLNMLLSGMRKALGLDTDGELTSTTAIMPHEVVILNAWQETLTTLSEMASRHKLEISGGALLTLIDRILSAKTINTQGAPLRGMQIMGLLETRALDFDNVIVPSLNERVFPSHNPLKTLIPHLLRHAYGMTTIEMLDDEQAYFFSHLLSRARRAVLITDSRPTGHAPGEISRYLRNLMLNAPTGLVKYREIPLNTRMSSERRFEISRNHPVVEQALKEYLTPAAPGEKPRNLSASAIKAYLNCPMEFFLLKVLGLEDEEDPSQFIDAKTYGTCVHAVLQDLFTPFKNKIITCQVLDNMMRSDIAALARSAINRHHLDGRFDANPDAVPGEAQMLADVIAQYVRKHLENEKLRTPFTFVGAEVLLAGRWEMAPGISVNFKGLIDRIDRMSDGSLSFVDYKTGADKLDVDSIDALFHQQWADRNDAMFQLLTYAFAASEMTYGKMFPMRQDIRPELFRLQHVYDDPASAMMLGEKVISSHRMPEVEPFRKQLAALITEIFTSPEPIRQCDNPENCRYCPLLTLCARRVPPK